MAEAFKSVTKWVGKVDRADLDARLRAPRLHPARVGPTRAGAARRPARSRRVRRRRASYAPVKGWRTGPDPDDVQDAPSGAARGQGSRCSTWARACYYADATSELLQFAEAAQVPVLTTLKAKGAFPENHPLSVGVRGSHAPSTSSQGRPALLDRLEPLPQPLQPLDSRRREEGHRAVHGGHAGHQPQLRDPARRDRRRQAHACRRSADEPRQARRRAQAARGDRGDPQGQADVHGQVPSRGIESNETPINPYRVLGDLEGARSRRTRSSPQTPATRATRPARSTRRRSRAAISAGATSPRWASAWPARSRPSSPYPEPAVRATSPATRASAT